MPTTDLHKAAASGDAAWLAELLCCLPYLVNDLDSNGRTALLLAAGGGWADCVRSLLATGEASTRPLWGTASARTQSLARRWHHSALQPAVWVGNQLHETAWPCD